MCSKESLNRSQKKESRSLTFGLACCAIDMMLVLLSYPALAQQPAETVYHIKVVTKSGEHYKGILSDVTDANVYVAYEKRLVSGRVALTDIRKIVLRRNSKKNAMITGAIIGGLAAGFASYNSLQRNQPSSAVNYGITLTFAATGGAAAGLLVGSGIGNLKKIVVRPAMFANPELSLFRQLEPFTWRYHQDIINRLPKTPQQ
ncbi:hypothetical protein [Spirosoma panaciterrae]|uniref:hypothetical protein n=1 Tax=Spirosoma panaciterrae TaxID=496058 RepID=UPI0012FB5395|nr:hypothetical protein [Spirosoma panaciterrae]